MISVDFHIHTRYSADSLAQPAAVLKAAHRKRVDRVVITDHNTIEGGLAAAEIDPQRAITGEEIMTTDGELLAAFVRENVPAGLTPNKTIDLLRMQGAFISVSHPYDAVRRGHWEPDKLEAIADLVDAVEGFNARCFSMQYNLQAQEFAHRHNLLMTAGSDAHVPLEIGTAVMVMPEFNTPDELRQALKQAHFKARLAWPWVHFFSRYAKLHKRLQKARN